MHLFCHASTTLIKNCLLDFLNEKKNLDKNRLYYNNNYLPYFNLPYKLSALPPLTPTFLISISSLPIISLFQPLLSHLCTIPPAPAPPLLLSPVVLFSILFSSSVGSFFSHLFSSLWGSKELRILILGLDGAGKTTILYRLQVGEVVTTIPSESAKSLCIL